MRRQTTLFTAVALILAVSAFFVANVPLTAGMWPISLAAILLFSAPVVYGAVQWLGPKGGLLAVGGLGLYALLFETIAVQTGLPYGDFRYGQLLGPHLFGSVPATVLVAWSPLVLGALALLPKTGLRLRVITGTILLVAIDLVLDPAAVQLGFWSWQVPGPYYGVPYINFFGWIISGSIAVAAMGWLENRFKLPPLPSVLWLNLSAIIFFWSMVNLFAAQFIPAIVGLGLIIFIWRARRVIH